MTAAYIRQQFLDFFKTKGHQIVPSAPIVIKNDPTLLFTDAGMNQFKDYFLGNKKADFTRVADTQKCLRVSGKHNDLEEVGVDTYHHTMFEMLGNWSFGDYFKAEAIAWSWELLTEVYKLDKDRLYVTVFEGDSKENLPFDQEAYDEWKKWIAEDRILKGNKKDNFWEMGDTGPCGPCSEIHVDCRPDSERAMVDGASLVNADHPQVIEIWNNVFMEFNRLKDGNLQALPAKHVDTGMGFERLVRVIQGKQSNYDTDIFTDTIKVIESIVNKTYDFSDSKQAIAFRVLSDHIRAISFTIADGQLPSNTGGGYVIRRILRRAVRYYYSYLDYKQPLLFQLVKHLANQFEQVFPELHAQADFVSKVIGEEEEAFLKTLDKGIKRFDDYLKTITTDTIDGKFAFELYDTYGFPLDLTQLMASEEGKKVDQEGFDNAMKAQKDRSRAATTIDTEDWVEVYPIQQVMFVGYEHLSADTKVHKYRKIKAKGKDLYQIVLETTPFYAESGGQVGDKGVLIFGEESIPVVDTKKENDLIIQFVLQLPQDIKSNVTAKVDWTKRLATTYNHSATHLMHSALRQVLGTHVAQKGSLVNEEVLRFDFSHFSKMTDEEILQVEKIVNNKIRENIPVVIKEMPKDEAIAMGAMALFGEKYGDKVRVVVMDANYSIELCGGTHVGYTGQIGLFKIVTESAVAAGVRRIEALTGATAFEYVQEKVSTLKHIVDTIKAKEPLAAIEKLTTEKAALEKKIESLESKAIAQLAKQYVQTANLIPKENITVQYITASVELDNPDAVKRLANEIKNLVSDSLVVLTCVINNKPCVAIAIQDNVVNTLGLDAGKIIKQNIAGIIKGGGGGQKTLASAGGQIIDNLSNVFETVKALI
jgi:alanyl-tRNA synthetase